ncbi:uncharacterized protein [Bemisia tabaci]|uniref:uncharacterized protein n=1 Tax=Bemisia tabaci TaxID=7038 RepID=UPI003B27DE69
MNPSPKLSSLSSNPDVVQILYPPLEVRVCRMSLSERPRDQQTYKQNFSQPTLRPKKTSPKPKRKRLKAPKEKLRKEPVQLPVIGGVPETMQRNLSAQIQPLMAVLMSPRPQSASTSSYDSETSSESDKKAVPRLSVKSLELPEKCAGLIPKGRDCPRRSRNLIAWRRVGPRGRPDTAPLSSAVPMTSSTPGAIAATAPTINGLLDAFLLDCAQLSLSPRYEPANNPIDCVPENKLRIDLNQ